jgi:hypothetical protein
MAMDANEFLQHPNTHRQLPSQYYRFLFPRLLIPQSMVTEESYIWIKRNHQFINKYNPIIISTIGYNHNINFTILSPKVLAAIYYITNYTTKAQVNWGQLILAMAILKKA